MKCDKLTAYNVVATADVNPEVVDSLGCTEWAGYDKDEVDEAISELLEENATLRGANDEKTERIVELQKQVDELKQKLEDAKATAYTESVDAGMENRRLKRALWIARAELCRRLDVDRYLRNHRNSWYNENFLTWADACVAMEVKMCKAENKCRAKVEEYK